MRTRRRPIRQWWDEVRCHFRIIRTLATDVEHYGYCGIEHREYWEKN